MTWNFVKFYGDCIDSMVASGKWTIPDDFPKGEEIKCTCGVKFTGGICSDWCDTNNPPPETEELPF